MKKQLPRKEFELRTRPALQGLRKALPNLSERTSATDGEEMGQGEDAPA
jgi:hypothetical protein